MARFAGSSGGRWACGGGDWFGVRRIAEAERWHEQPGDLGMRRLGAPTMGQRGN